MWGRDNKTSYTVFWRWRTGGLVHGRLVTHWHVPCLRSSCIVLFFYLVHPGYNFERNTLLYLSAVES